MRTLASKCLNAVRAPSPVVEVRQIVVLNLRGRGLFRRSLRFLWKYLLVELCGLDPRVCSRLSFHSCFTTRAPRHHLTALHGSISWE